MTSLLIRQGALLALTLAYGAAACGGATDDSSGDSGNGACNVTLTGAQAGSLDCSNVLSIFAADSGLSAVDFSTTASAPVVNIAIRVPGELAARTYHSTDAGVIASVLVNLNNTSAWVAVSDPSSQTPLVGSFALTVSSVSTLSSDANGKVFRVHGSLTATLPSMASTAATGTVTLNATF